MHRQYVRGIVDTLHCIHQLIRASSAGICRQCLENELKKVGQMYNSETF